MTVASGIQRVISAGVPTQLDVVPEMPHVWHLFAGLLPEADAALTEVGRWVGALIRP